MAQSLLVKVIVPVLIFLLIQGSFTAPLAGDTSDELLSPSDRSLSHSSMTLSDTKKDSKTEEVLKPDSGKSTEDKMMTDDTLKAESPVQNDGLGSFGRGSLDARGTLSSAKYSDLIREVPSEIAGDDTGRFLSPGGLSSQGSLGGDGLAKSESSRTTLGESPSFQGHGIGSPNLRHHGGRRVKMSCEPVETEQLKKMLGPALNVRYMSIDKPFEPEEEQLKTPAALGAIEGGFGVSDDALISHQGTFNQPEFAVEKGFRKDLPDELNYLLSYLQELKAAKTHGEGRHHGHKKEGHHTSHDSDLQADELKTSSDTPVHSGVENSTKGDTERIKRDLKKKPPKETPEESTEPWQCSQKIVWQDLGEDHFPRYMRSVTCTQGPCWFNVYQCKEKSFTVKVLRRISDECVPVYASNTDSSDSRRIPVRYEQEWIFEERAVPFCCECGRRDF